MKSSLSAFVFLLLMTGASEPAFAQASELEQRVAQRRAERLRGGDLPSAASAMQVNAGRTARTSVTAQRRSDALDTLRDRVRRRALLRRGTAEAGRRTDTSIRRTVRRINPGAIRRSVIRDTRDTTEATERRSRTVIVNSTQKMLNLINNERIARGVAPLTVNTLLRRSAQDHAEDMVARGYFSGTTPDGLSAEQRIKRTGYAFMNEEDCNCEYWSYRVSEVFAKGSDVPENIFSNWLGSSKAFDQLLSPAFEDVGIGTKDDVWVVDLGRISIQEITPFTVMEQRKFSNDVLRLTNEERQREGLFPLQRNALLDRSALAHAKDMYERGFFAHETPEGVAVRDRIENTGYLDSVTGFGVGENIAKGQDTAREVMEGWMNSPGHRANILKEDFDEIGIGLYGDVWVQNFGVRMD